MNQSIEFDSNVTSSTTPPTNAQPINQTAEALSATSSSTPISSTGTYRFLVLRIPKNGYTFWYYIPINCVQSIYYTRQTNSINVQFSCGVIRAIRNPIGLPSNSTYDPNSNQLSISAQYVSLTNSSPPSTTSGQYAPTQTSGGYYGQGYDQNYDQNYDQGTGQNYSNYSQGTGLNYDQGTGQSYPDYLAQTDTLARQFANQLGSGLTSTTPASSVAMYHYFYL